MTYFGGPPSDGSCTTGVAALTLRLREEDATDDGVDCSLESSFDGVDALESLSFPDVDEGVSPFFVFVAPFLFFETVACWFLTSFCFRQFVSLYLRTRSSGTHSSQL